MEVLTRRHRQTLERFRDAAGLPSECRRDLSNVPKGCGEWSRETLCVCRDPIRSNARRAEGGHVRKHPPSSRWDQTRLRRAGVMHPRECRERRERGFRWVWGAGVSRDASRVRTNCGSKMVNCHCGFFPVIKTMHRDSKRPNAVSSGRDGPASVPCSRLGGQRVSRHSVQFSAFGSSSPSGSTRTDPSHPASNERSECRTPFAF